MSSSLPKVIYHACVDGYLTEIQFEEGRSRLFSTIQEALTYLSFFCNPSVCPQEQVLERCSKSDILTRLITEKEVENV